MILPGYGFAAAPLLPRLTFIQEVSSGGGVDWSTGFDIPITDFPAGYAVVAVTGYTSADSASPVPFTFLGDTMSTSVFHDPFSSNSPVCQISTVRTQGGTGVCNVALSSDADGLAAFVFHLSGIRSITPTRTLTGEDNDIGPVTTGVVPGQCCVTIGHIAESGVYVYGDYWERPAGTPQITGSRYATVAFINNIPALPVYGQWRTTGGVVKEDSVMSRATAFWR